MFCKRIWWRCPTEGNILTRFSPFFYQNKFLFFSLRFYTDGEHHIPISAAQITKVMMLDFFSSRSEFFQNADFVVNDLVLGINVLYKTLIGHIIRIVPRSCGFTIYVYSKPGISGWYFCVIINASGLYHSRSFEKINIFALKLPMYKLLMRHNVGIKNRKFFTYWLEICPKNNEQWKIK